MHLAKAGATKIICILQFNGGANCITSILGVTIKGKKIASSGCKFFPLRVAPNEGGDGFRGGRWV